MIRLLPANTGGKVRFELSDEPENLVFVAGKFNNWSLYNFVVNAVWSAGLKCADRIPNACGSLNNVLHI